MSVAATQYTRTSLAERLAEVLPSLLARCGFAAVISASCDTSWGTILSLPGSELTSASRQSGNSNLGRSPVMKRAALVAILCTAIVACAEVPRDPDGTLRRVQETHVIRVGLVASEKDRAPAEQRFIEQVAQATGARADTVRGPAEAVLSRLEEGELDVVVGEFHATSPWGTRVTFVPGLKDQARGEGKMALAVAARNGENRWIALLHRHADVLKAPKS